MDRREFFKLAGIGTIAIAGAPTLFLKPGKDKTKKIERFDYSITELSDELRPYDIVRYYSDSDNDWIYTVIYDDKLSPIDKYAPIMKLSKKEIKSIQHLSACVGSDLDTIELKNPKTIYEHS